MTSQSCFRIPIEEYPAPGSAFTPVLFDVESWGKLSVDAGMRDLVGARKHRDGLALYRGSQAGREAGHGIVG